MFLNNKIKEARLQKEMTQKKLSQELTNLGLKTSNTAIANWESGLNKPDADTILALCKILEKDGNYFFNYSSYHLKPPNSNYEIDLEGLDEQDMKEINQYIEFLKEKKQQNRKKK